MSVDETLNSFYYCNVSTVEFIASQWDEATKEKKLKPLSLSKLERMRDDFMKDLSAIDENEEVIRKAISDVHSNDELDADKKVYLTSVFIGYMTDIRNYRKRMTDDYLPRIYDQMLTSLKRLADQSAALRENEVSVAARQALKEKEG